MMMTAAVRNTGSDTLLRVTPAARLKISTTNNGNVIYLRMDDGSEDWLDLIDIDERRGTSRFINHVRKVLDSYIEKHIMLD